MGCATSSRCHLRSARVHRLTAPADHRGQRALGIGDPRRPVARSGLRAGDQRLRQPLGKVGESEVGDMQIGAPQPLADHPEHRFRQPPVVLKQRQEVPSLEDQQRRLDDRRHVRRTRPAVQQGNLPED